MNEKEQQKASLSRKRKSALLGMPFGTASHRLNREVLFAVVCKAALNTCYRCKRPIETVRELSLDHKEAWEGAADPVATFFDLANTAFSHAKCNYAAGKRRGKKYASVRERNQARWKKQAAQRKGNAEYNAKRRLARRSLKDKAALNGKTEVRPLPTSYL